MTERVSSHDPREPQSVDPYLLRSRMLVGLGRHCGCASTTADVTSHVNRRSNPPLQSSIEEAQVAWVIPVRKSDRDRSLRVSPQRKESAERGQNGPNRSANANISGRRGSSTPSRCRGADLVDFQGRNVDSRPRRRSGGVQGNVLRAVLDWKSDVSPSRDDRLHHISQLKDDLYAVGAPKGAIVYMSFREIGRRPALKPSAAAA